MPPRPRLDRLRARLTAPSRAGEEPHAVAVGGRLFWLAAFGLALVGITLLVRPFETGPVGPDAAASVLYFRRIMSGVQLEAFVNTTPKPLLTLLYGAAWSITGDWRAVSAVAIVGAAALVALGARLAAGIAGIVAGALVFVVLLFNRQLSVETASALGLPWALAFVAAAGIALTLRPRRYGLAGGSLLLGCLVRQEVFLVLAAATAVVAWLALRRRLPPRAPLLLVGWLAIPVMLLHDVLTTGDPLYWARVSGIAAEGASTHSVRYVLRELAQLLVAYPLATAAAAIGVILAVRRSRDGRIVALGIVALGLGTALLVIAAAAAERQTLGHYYNPIWIALGLAAAIGIGLMLATARTFAGQHVGREGARSAPSGETGPGASRERPTRRRVVDTALTLGALVLGLIVVRPLLLESTAAVDLQRTTAAHADAAAAVLAPIAERFDARGLEVGPHTRADPTRFRLLVPRQVLTRLAVDLDIPITLIGRLVPYEPTPGLIHEGLVVFHDSLLDRGEAGTSRFEGRGPITVDGVRFELVSDQPPGTWIWQTTE